MRFGLGRISPVEHPVLLELAQSERDLDVWVIVAPACLEQQDRRSRVLGQPIGEHASGRTGPDDDVVVSGVHQDSLRLEVGFE